jgi:mRNA-degrading endonuclease toxin of MazEF toxin-antitoxin module
VPKPARGRIVKADVLDPQGRNRKRRPLVIVTPTEQILPGGSLWGVAITTAVSKPLPNDCVALPFHPQGLAKTKLKTFCAAKCTWLQKIEHEEDIREYLGVVPEEQLLEILKKVDALQPPPTGWEGGAKS